MKLKVEAKLEAEFVEVFGPLAEKELNLIMQEAIYRTRRAFNKNAEVERKVLTADKNFDTI